MCLPTIERQVVIVIGVFRRNGIRLVGYSQTTPAMHVRPIE